MDVAAGREVHDRIRTPADGPDHLLDLLGHRRSDGGIADIGIDLDQEIAADDHRLQFRMVDVRRDDRATGGNLLPDEFARHVIRDMRAEAFAVPDKRCVWRCAADVFADGDEFHFRRDDTGAGIGELGHGLAIPCFPRRVANRKFRCQAFAGDETVVFRLHMAAIIGFGVAARGDPAFAQARQAVFDAYSVGRVRIGAGGIVNDDRRFARRRVQADFAQGYADIGVQNAGLVDLARGGKRALRDGQKRGLGGDIHREAPMLRWRPSSGEPER